MDTDLAAVEASGDRLSFSFILAAAVHGLLILGVSFSPSIREPASNVLEITIARQQSDIAPEEADFLAQANQEGSGTLDKKAEISTTELSDFFDDKINDIQQAQFSKRQKKQETKHDDIITSARNEIYKIAKSKRNQKSELIENEAREIMSLAERSLEIASLEAQLEERKQAFAKRPRRRQLTAVSARASIDAAYMDAWRRKIELEGNINFPQLDSYGSLTLLVGIRSNGTVERIEVRRSSGSKQLDAAAVKIVRKASPFDPFSEELKKHTDILEIIRTWKFEKGRVTSSE